MKKYNQLKKKLLKQHRLIKDVIEFDEIEEQEDEQERIDALDFHVWKEIEYLCYTGHEEALENGGNLASERVIGNIIKKLEQFQQKNFS